MSPNVRRTILIIFSILALASLFFASKLKFEFYLEQFFPEGDEDLAFFQEFVKDFESDINFLLIALEREEGVFEKEFLTDFHEMTLSSRDLPFVEEVMSLTKVSYPLKTPFGVTSSPAIHIDQPEKYDRDKKRILQDVRFVNKLIAENGKSIVLSLKTKPRLSIEESQLFMPKVDSLVQSFGFEKYHFLGAANFQKELASMQQREVMVSTVISGILVTLIMFFIFRKIPGIFISLTSIGMGLLLFFGILGVLGRPLNAMAALYPVLMVIVGTSDVIHIMSKYIDELKKGFSKKESIRTTIKEIGLATLLTSVTTAVGFAALITSRAAPIKDFGWNAAIGVMVAYVTVIFFTTALLSKYEAHQLIKMGKGEAFWGNLMNRSYFFTRNNTSKIAIGGLVIILLSLFGISKITTNYTIESNLPLRQKLTEDFFFFEKNYAGFRPVEFAIFTQGDYEADDYEVLQEMEKIENHISTIPSFRSTLSATAIYKSINQMNKGNKSSEYLFPNSKSKFEKYKKVANKLPQSSSKIFTSKDNKKARITSNMLDIGADNIKKISLGVDDWIASNVDSSVIKVKQIKTQIMFVRVCCKGWELLFC